ncbi:TPA_asm: RNA-dependent RNA polymerase [Arceuthobium sichuanense virus 5]|nr:TPA_asm: RNA-dependent RNA polymerase [Arceuthobium sichuanense virus 5]
MDHRFRKIPVGLIKLEEIPERRLREEFKVIVDPFAYEAVSRLVPFTLRYELEGWARSYYTLEKHVEAIENYDRPKVSEPADSAWNETKQMVLKMFKRFDSVDPISFYDFDKVKWIPSSAAGYGYVASKGENDNYTKAKRTAVTIAEKLDHDRNYAPEALLQSTPDVAFTRTQLCQMKVKTKVRNVWGEAFHYVLLEGLFADPLITAFKGIDSFYFIGRDPLLAVPLLIEEIVGSKDYVYQFDWSAFDASVQEWEIRFAFQCLECMLRFPSNIEAQIWRFIVELFIYRKIAGPNQVIYLKTHGIPSGSCFTNIIGSITNYVRIQYMFKTLTSNFAVVYTHGDDSLSGISSTQYVRMADFQPICDRYYWNINTLKSEVSRRKETTTFLSRTVREGQNARDELTCLRMLVYPEYDVARGSLSTLRAKSISRDAGINSHFLFKIYRYLQERYGCDQELPSHHQSWDPIEFDLRRYSYQEICNMQSL